MQDPQLVYLCARSVPTSGSSVFCLSSFLSLIALLFFPAVQAEVMNTACFTCCVCGLFDSSLIQMKDVCERAGVRVNLIPSLQCAPPHR